MRASLNSSIDVVDGLEFLVTDFSFRLILFTSIAFDSQGMCFFNLGFRGMTSSATFSCEAIKLLYVALGDGDSTSACRASNLFLTVMLY